MIKAKSVSAFGEIIIMSKNSLMIIMMIMPRSVRLFVVLIAIDKLV
jgi:hypothetical protein